jgi:hypothetical protein
VAAFSRDLWQRSQLSDDWSGTWQTLSVYWQVYGGSRALFRSPAFLASIIISTVCFPIWTQNLSAGYVFSVVPNLLGFSIGAMAIVLAFPTTKIFEIITEEGRDDSYYLDLAAKFCHFVFVQVSALIFALVATAFPFFLISFLALSALIYAIGTGAMTALALFEVAIFYNKSHSTEGK